MRALSGQQIETAAAGPTSMRSRLGASTWATVAAWSTSSEFRGITATTRPIDFPLETTRTVRSDYAARKGSKEKSLAVVHRVTHAAPEHPLEREPVSPQQGARWSAGDAAREPACASPSAIRALKLAAVAKVIGKPRVGAVEVAAADSHGNDPGGDEQRQKRAEQKQTRRPHHPRSPSADRQGSDPLHVGAVAHPRNGGHER